MVRLRNAVPLILVALAGCGDTEPAALPPEAAVSPQETLRAVGSALRDVESFHIEGSQTKRDGVTRFEGDIAPDGAVRFSLSKDGAAAKMIVMGDDVYVSGDGPFWEQTKAPAEVRDLLAGRWVKVPAGDEFTELAEQMQPDVLADCLSGGLGRLTIRKDTLDGRPVVVLVDKGDRPGSEPSELYVAAADPQLPVRATQSGPERPGGPPPDPKCSSDDEEDKDGPVIRADLRFSRWDEPVEIEAPADALDLEELARQADGRSTV